MNTTRYHFSRIAAYDISRLAVWEVAYGANWFCYAGSEKDAVRIVEAMNAQADLAALRAVAEEMAGALNTLTTRYSLLCRDAKCVNIATDELITRADAALASYARLQKEKTP